MLNCYSIFYLPNLEQRADGRINSKLPCIGIQCIGCIVETSIFDEILKITIGTSAPGLIHKLSV
jgi:hypothetical protein